MNRDLFVQQGPTLSKNQFLDDEALQSYLSRVIPKKLYQEMVPDLENFGNRVRGELLTLHNSAMERHNEPVLQQIDGWGERVDVIKVCEAWDKIHAIACEEGIIHIGYRKEFREKFGQYARLLQYTKLYLFGPSAGMVTCPLAMTDGAARLVEQLELDGTKLPDLAKKAYQHFITTNPDDFWTSGQWMTERTGGSDVSNTETIAIKGDGEEYKLYGYKFFTSATTSDVTFTLAKIQENGKVGSGSRGLSMFVVKLRDENGKMNGIKVAKLKDKFGTRSLPTAELELVGTTAFLVGKPGEGVKTISYLFNVTRLHCMIGVTGSMRRMMALMREYAEKRRVFGKLLSEQPLHLKMMSDMEILFRGSLIFTLDLSSLLGKSENGGNERSDHLLRLLTPVGKLYVTKQSAIHLAEGMESFGGYGYMEDTGIPSLYRDAFVNTIWEGTSNVLSMDLFRAITREPKAMQYLYDVISEKCQGAPHQLSVSIGLINDSVKSIQEFSKRMLGGKIHQPEMLARNFAFTVARVYIGSLLVQHAIATQNDKDIYIANQWCQKDKMNLLNEFHEYNMVNRIALSKL